jgi:DNA-binding GntR family transcriptional regulator
VYLVDKIQMAVALSRNVADPEGASLGADRGAITPRYGLPRVLPRNLSEEIYAILRRAILAHEIDPGTRLLEADLAAELGVSRAPIREAMRKLEHEGLLESLPRRGATVVSVPEAEIQTFYELRADIEAKAFAAAAGRITAADVEDLRDKLRAIHAAYEARDVDAVTAADRDFHGAVLGIAGLTLLRRVWSNLDGPLRLRVYQLVEAAPDPDTAFIESAEYSHARLLGALEAGDAEEAARLVRGHILEVKELVREAHDARREG